MPFYFAYGSNMRRTRLEERIAAVESGQRASLVHYAHSFAKLGADGTGKGTILPARGCRVEGVVYRMTDAQLAELCKYEPGYCRIVVEVITADSIVSAVTFQAIQLHDGLQPMPWYVDHYLAGMAEHRFPDDYVDAILADAGVMARQAA